MEKLLFPGFLFFFEVAFLVVFGLLVEYDSRGAPDAELRQALASQSQTGFIRGLESSLSTTKTYPCKTPSDSL